MVDMSSLFALKNGKKKAPPFLVRLDEERAMTTMVTIINGTMCLISGQIGE